ncbi:hypothetical protein [Tunicatimonas pelagia]|uniref:hypothetical protein n=1 Tax=Tunicatimonas pelagia TaxID=931531 RepID=UPI002666748F|nr:hypothetical protein [Tunicatimonas pelagia]WKN41943.1 hypothetical protein P0M28_23150 [Tunicatimonas pelagia]
MKKFFVLICVPLLIFSCQDEVIQEKNLLEPTQTQFDGFQVSNDRLVFDDKATLVSLLDSLSSLDENQYSSWVKEVSFEPYRNSPENFTDDLAVQIHSSILNGRKEFQVANDIVWFNQDTEYILFNTTEDAFQELKKKVLSGGEIEESDNIMVNKFEEVFLQDEIEPTNARLGVDNEVLEYGTIKLKSPDLKKNKLFGKVYYLPVGASKEFYIDDIKHRFGITPYAYSGYYTGIHLGLFIEFAHLARSFPTKKWKTSNARMKGSLRFSIDADGSHALFPTTFGFPTYTYDVSFSNEPTGYAGTNFTTTVLDNVEFYIDLADITWDSTHPWYDASVHTYVYRNATYRYDRIYF